MAKIPARLHDFPEVAGRVDMSLAHTLANLGHIKTARRAYTQAIGYFSTAYGPRDRHVLSARLDREQVRIDPHSLQTAPRRLAALRTDILASPKPHVLLLDRVDSELAHAAFLQEDFRLCETRYTALLPRLAHAKPSMLADAYRILSMCRSRRGYWSRALEDARKARAIDMRNFGASSPITLSTQIAVETALYGLGRYDKAKTILHGLVQQFRHLYGPLHPTTILMTHDLGVVTLCSGRPSASVHWLRVAARDRAQVLGTHHPWYALTESMLAEALIQDHQLDQAGKALSRAQQALDTNGSAAPYVWAAFLEEEADMALARGQAHKAVTRYTQALDFTGHALPTRRKRLAMLHLGKGLALVDAGHTAKGRQWLRKSLHILGHRPYCRDGQIAMARQRLH